MRSVYAAQFTLGSNAPADERFRNAVSSLRDWIVTKYKRTWNWELTLPAQGDEGDGTRSLSPLPGHVLSISTEEVADGHQFGVRWTHPHDRDETVSWVTECDIARLADDVEFSIVVRLSSDTAVLRPFHFEVGSPGIVRELFRTFDLRVSGWPAFDEHRDVDATAVPEIVAELLAPTRAIPVLIISVDAWSDRPLFDARVLQRQLIGLANVVSLTTKWAGFRLTDLIGKERSCYNGALRLYWPRFQLTDDPFDHPLYLPSMLASEDSTSLSRKLFLHLSNVAVLRFKSGHVISSVAAKAQRQRDEQLESWRKQALAGKDLEPLLLQAWSDLDALKDENKRLGQQIDQLSADLAAQRESFRQIQMFREQTQPSAPSATPELTEQTFESVAEALSAAKARFSGPLLFLSSAEESAGESPFRQPDRVYQLFEAMHEIALRWRENGGSLGERWENAFERYGFDYKPSISQTTLSKWGAEYMFEYRGKRLLFEQHVTLGAKQADTCLSVHMLRDDAARVIVIGYCGRHLTNTTT